MNSGLNSSEFRVQTHQRTSTRTRESTASRTISSVESLRCHMLCTSNPYTLPPSRLLADVDSAARHFMLI
eukprot:scaffold542346_cov19-Prasinocladus_malaysianus.AAC.1